MTTDERRNIVELLVKNIIIGHGEIDLKLWYAPSFEDTINRQRSPDPVDSTVTRSVSAGVHQT